MRRPRRTTVRRAVMVAEPASVELARGRSRPPGQLSETQGLTCRSRSGRRDVELNAPVVCVLADAEVGDGGRASVAVRCRLPRPITTTSSSSSPTSSAVTPRRARSGRRRSTDGHDFDHRRARVCRPWSRSRQPDRGSLRPRRSRSASGPGGHLPQDALLGLTAVNDVPTSRSFRKCVSGKPAVIARPPPGEA